MDLAFLKIIATRTRIGVTPFLDFDASYSFRKHYHYLNTMEAYVRSKMPIEPVSITEHLDLHFLYV
jgi:hypothetical protein